MMSIGLFCGKVKFDNLGFSRGKSEAMDFSETIAACDLVKMNEGMRVLNVKVFS